MRALVALALLSSCGGAPAHEPAPRPPPSVELRLHRAGDPRIERPRSSGPSGRLYVVERRRLEPGRRRIPRLAAGLDPATLRAHGGAAPLPLRVGPEAIELEVPGPAPEVVELSYELSHPGWRADHLLRVDEGGGRGSLSTRLSVTDLPIARERALLELYDGLPGGDERPPVRVWRGAAAIAPDTELSVAIGGSREVTLTERLVYRGAIEAPGSRSDPGWGTDSRSDVVREIVLGAGDGAGRIAGLVRLEGASPEDTGVLLGDGREAVRARFGVAHGLTGERVQTQVTRMPDGAWLRERYRVAVSSARAEPVAVEVREPLARSDAYRLIEVPADARRDGDELVFELAVPAGGRAEAELEIEYRF